MLDVASKADLDLYLKAKRAYDDNTPILPDDEFDELEKRVREAFPEEKEVWAVGRPVLSAAKFAHDQRMLSLDYVKTEDELRMFVARVIAMCEKENVRFTLEFSASVKGDGLSVDLKYIDGRLLAAGTRGDGTQGLDISHNMLKFKQIPIFIRGFTGNVHGELVAPSSVVRQLDPEGKTSGRSIAGGVCRRLSGFQCDLLEYYAFSYFPKNEPLPETETAQRKRLWAMGFKTLHVDPYTPLDVEGILSTHKAVEKSRYKIPFETDGTVYKLEDMQVQRYLGISTDRCPNACIAFKYEAKGATTQVLDVNYSVGMTGHITPVVSVTPTKVAGITITHANLVNWDEIARLDVAIGDYVKVIRTNDVLPKITEVLERPTKRTLLLEPVKCPVCGGKAERAKLRNGKKSAATKCTNQDCSAKIMGRLAVWPNSLEVIGIGDVILQALVESKLIKTPADLYKLDERQEELVDLDIGDNRKLGKIRTKKILDEIASKKQLPLDKFIGSLGVPHLRQVTAANLIDAAEGKLNSLDEWFTDYILTNKDKLGIPGCAEDICEGLEDAMPIALDLVVAGVTIELPASKAQTITLPLSGKSICFTGCRPSKKDMQILASAGVTVKGSVSTKTDLLIVKDKGTSNSSVKFAKEKAIKTATYEEFSKMLTIGEK